MTLRKRTGLWAPVVAYSSLIYFVSDQPTLPGPPLPVDKVLHALAYGLLAVLVLRAAHGGLKRLRWAPTAAALLFTAGYGALDEFHQSFVAGRDASGWDVTADALGAVLAAGVVAMLVGRERWRDRSPLVTIVERAGCPRCRRAAERIEELRGEVRFRFDRRTVDDTEAARVFPGEPMPLVFLNGRLVLRGDATNLGALHRMLRQGGDGRAE